jgi:hypothetical protein
MHSPSTASPARGQPWVSRRCASRPSTNHLHERIDIAPPAAVYKDIQSLRKRDRRTKQQDVYVARP